MNNNYSKPYQWRLKCFGSWTVILFIKITMFRLSTFSVICLFLVVVNARNAFIMDDRYVCIVKTSCLKCLELSQCSWCPSENKCFSKKLSEFGEYCSNNTIDHVDYGLSLEENAECSCNKGVVEQSCYPPGVSEGPLCSGRGTCVCGQCVCDSIPDPEHPSKMVMGEFCEYDNFSCDDPKCNEGPYSLSHPIEDDGSSKLSYVDIPDS